MPLGQNMIKFGHDGPQMSCQRACWKGYDGVDHLEVEPFVVQWIVLMEEDMHELRVVENHMSLWGVVGKEMCCCRLMLRLQEGRDLDQP